MTQISHPHRFNITSKVIFLATLVMLFVAARARAAEVPFFPWGVAQARAESSPAVSFFPFGFWPVCRSLGDHTSPFCNPAEDGRYLLSIKPTSQAVKAIRYVIRGKLPDGSTTTINGFFYRNGWGDEVDWASGILVCEPMLGVTIEVKEFTEVNEYTVQK